MPMTTRTSRRTRTRRLALDMQLDSDVDMELEPEPASLPPSRRRAREEDRDQDQDDDEGSNVDIEAVAEGDDEDEPEEDEEDDEIQSDAYESVPPKAPRGGLKIRLKMPAALARYETPVVESEDSMDSLPTNTRLTTRQAVLASVMDSSHVSLSAPKQKKAPLNETELALRREETARKRRNLTEKKLEDEKVETINRLLKKQSRPRKKRNTAQRTDMDDIAPTPRSASNNSNSVYKPSTAKPKKSSAPTPDEGDEDEGDDEDGMDDVDAEEGVDGEMQEREQEQEREVEREVEIPTMYRWVSTSRIPVVEGTDPMSTEMKMQMTFSVPVAALPQTPSGTDDVGSRFAIASSETGRKGRVALGV
ncbi:hypothetical protein C0991_005868 [Blastosporella zonata]|nr:hypothetical protein C0991_005868 [Blastosporella zonata]